MKTHYSLPIITALVLCLTGCNKETAEIAVSNHSFTTTAPDGKVTLASDFSMTWNQGDEVSIFDGTTTYVFTADKDGTTTNLVNTDVDIDPDKTYFALYPASKDNVFDTDGVTFTIPSIQHLTKNPFELCYSVSSCSGSVKAFTFKNVASLIAFEVTEDNVNNVTISAAAGEHLTGTVKASYSDGSYTFVPEGEAGTSIVLASDDTFTPGYYYAAVLPQTFSEGLSITITKKDGSRTQRHIKAFTLGRSKYVNLEQFDASREWKGSYTIATAAELQSFLLAASTCGEDFTATLANDIDLKGITLESAESFAGTFDGADFKLCNWTTENPLFELASGTIKNVIIDENSTLIVNQGLNRGFIAGTNTGLITKCTSNGYVKANGSTFSQETIIGAIAGENTGTVSECTNNGKISISMPTSDTKGKWIGGVVGRTASMDDATASSVTNCTNNGEVIVSTKRNSDAILTIGGVVGGTPANIATTMFYSAGLDDYGKISNCTNNADVSYKLRDNNNVQCLNLGGVVGYVEGSIDNCDNKEGHSVKVYYDNTSTPLTAAICRGAIGGIAGVVVWSAEKCDNAADMDIDIRFQGGDFIAGAGIYSGVAIAGVVGIAGPNTGAEQISECTNSGHLTFKAGMPDTKSSAFYFGGVAAFCKAKITKCSNSGVIDITSTGCYKYAGGITGMSGYEVSYCKNSGNITVDGVIKSVADASSNKDNRSKQTYLGGVTGYHAAKVTKDNKSEHRFLYNINEGKVTFLNAGLASGALSTTNNYIGGLLGMGFSETRGDTTKEGGLSKNTGDVYIDSPGKFYAGGIVGRTAGKVLSIENSGDVTAIGGIQSGSMIGGGVGVADKYIGVKIDDDGSNVNYGVGDKNCGYTFGSTGNVTVVEADGTVSGVGLGAGKINGTGSVKVGSKAKGVNWHSCTISGALNVTGKQDKVGILSGGGIDEAVSCGYSSNYMEFKEISLNGVAVSSKEDLNTKLGNAITLGTNIQFVKVKLDGNDISD